MWTPPITWLAGQELDAATLDEQVRDNLKALTEYDAFTPVLHSSGTAVTVSAASGGLIHAGNVVDGWFELTINAPGTGSYTLDMPVAAASHWFPKPFGQGTCINGAGGYYPIQLICTGSTTVAAMAQSGSARVTQTSPFTFATGHQICGTFHYEAA
jgi:hypothetical protein